MDTPLPIDHVVIAVRDLDQAVADYRTLGFTVAPGGRHPSPRRSHNALVVFADGAYLELIAWDGEAPAEPWWRTLDAHGEGLVDFALLPADTSAVLRAARARGLSTIAGPLDGSRLRPDGALVQWQTARHETRDLPFLCGDVTPRGLRVPEGEVRVHANGALGVAGVAVAVRDVDASLARYRALLGSAADGVRVTDDETASVRTATIPLAAATLTLLGPTGAGAAGAAGAHAAGDAGAVAATAGAAFDGAALRRRLAGRGEGPCRLVLRGPAGAVARELDPRLTHGVALTLT